MDVNQKALPKNSDVLYCKKSIKKQKGSRERNRSIDAKNTQKGRFLQIRQLYQSHIPQLIHWLSAYYALLSTKSTSKHPQQSKYMKKPERQVLLWRMNLHFSAKASSQYQPKQKSMRQRRLLHKSEQRHQKQHLQQGINNTHEQTRVESCPDIYNFAAQGKYWAAYGKNLYAKHEEKHLTDEKLYPEVHHFK